MLTYATILALSLWATDPPLADVQALPSMDWIQTQIRLNDEFRRNFNRNHRHLSFHQRDELYMATATLRLVFARMLSAGLAERDEEKSRALRDIRRMVGQDVYNSRDWQMLPPFPLWYFERR